MVPPREDVVVVVVGPVIVFRHPHVITRDAQEKVRTFAVDRVSGGVSLKRARARVSHTAAARGIFARNRQ